MKRIKKLAFISFFSISFFFIFSELSSAQTTSANGLAEGLTISPPLFELDLDKGDTVSYKIQVTNPTKNLIELYPSAMDFQAAGEGGQPNFIDPKNDNSKFSIGNWITFDVPKIALLPEQVVEFQFTITVPDNAEPGGHYGVVFLATKPPEGNEGASHVSLSSKVGSLLLVRIPGEIKESATLEEFSTPWFYFAPPINFVAFIRNNGNIHFKPYGDIVIRNWRGREAHRIPINPVKNNVLPESHRKFESKWDPKSTYFWQEPFGRFSATLTAGYGEKNSLNGEVHFWIIPWWLIIAAGSVLFIALLLIIIITLIRKKRRKRNEKKSPHSLNPRYPLYPRPNQNSDYSRTQSTMSRSNRFSEPEEEQYSIPNKNNRPAAYPEDFNRTVPTKNKKIMRF